MPPRGQRPKPRALKIVTGNPGKRPLGEPEFVPAGPVEKPGFLKPEESRIWDTYAPELIRMGTLTSADVHQFAAYCGLAAMLEEGVRHMNAAQINQMRQLAASFGMDATARARLGAHGNGDKAPNPEEEFFAAPA